MDPGGGPEQAGLVVHQGQDLETENVVSIPETAVLEPGEEGRAAAEGEEEQIDNDSVPTEGQEEENSSINQEECNTAVITAAASRQHQGLQAVMAAAVRDGGIGVVDGSSNNVSGGGGGGGIQRRVVVVGNTAHLVTIHPGPLPPPLAPRQQGDGVVLVGAADDGGGGAPPPPPHQADNTNSNNRTLSDTLDLRVKEELVTLGSAAATLTITTAQPNNNSSTPPPPDLITGHRPPLPNQQQPPPLQIITAAAASQQQNSTGTNTAAAAAETNGHDAAEMIDTSDFRMSEPTYQTLSSVNGRMTPPGYLTAAPQGHYATLTPLQPMTPLPPISSIPMGEKFGYPGAVSTPSSSAVTGSFTVMQNNSLAQISLHSPYSYDSKLVSMGMSPPHYTNNHMTGLPMSGQQHSPGALSPQPFPQNGGLHSPHKQSISPNPYESYRSSLDPQSPHDLSPTASGDTERSPTAAAGEVNHAAPAVFSSPSSVYTSNTPLTSTNNPSLNGMASISPHTISPHHSPSLPHAAPAHPHAAPPHHPRDLSPPSPSLPHHPSPILPPTTILHHASLPQHNALKSPNGSSTSSSGELEEINTKELAQRISAELKRYSIPQAIFAQRVLCRSQGTLSDLLRNPKPWSKLKSGRETFRRMFKWLQEPEFQRMSALRLAGECFSNYFLLSVTFL